MYGEKWFHMYIVSNRSKTLYTGFTGNLKKRIYEHKTGAFDGFTKRYRIDRLVYFERYKYANNGIDREKQVKRWTRIKKIQLIVSMNPTWKDLAEDWYPNLKKKEANT